MKANTYSLLNTPWMIDRSRATAFIPQLISILKGNEIKEQKKEFPVVYVDYGEDELYHDIPDAPSNSQYICVLSIKTPIFKYDQFCGPIGTRTMTRMLKEWEANDNVIGVVIDIDSPGGQVSGLAEFAKFIKNYSKPIVAYSDGMVASAAFYIAAACSGGIVINEHADFIGSIGTMLSYVDLDGMLVQMGAKVKDIYASGSPRKNEEVRAMQDNDSDELIIKQILNPYRDQFVKDMNSYRPGMNEEVFQGAVYRPDQALSFKLVDQIGDITAAFDKVIELSTSKKSNSKSNTNMNTKDRQKLQAVLGLDAPLAVTENGSYLNADQLDLVEGALTTNETENASLQQQLTEAQNNTEIQDQLTASTQSLTETENSVNTILGHAGLPVQGTLAEKLTALNAKVEIMGKADGAKPTNVRIGSDELSDSATVIGGVDVSSAMNN